MKHYQQENKEKKCEYKKEYREQKNLIANIKKNIGNKRI